MSKTVLLAAAAAFALTAGGASAAQKPVLGAHGPATAPIFHVAKGAKILYNQNSGDGEAVVSQNFTSGSYSPTYNAAGADDFVVPKKTTWTVTEVDVSGLYFNGSGTCSGNCQFNTSENVIFYADAKGMPGKAVKNGTFNGVKGTDNSGSLSISLGKKGVKLKAGTYWVSVVGNDPYVDTGWEWGWEQTSTIHGTEAEWENPQGGFGVGCTTWGNVGTCLGYNGDFAFDLQGSAKKK
ncbi:MAG TPA: hypothetical protein VHY79_15670 [Rhizomicrobium sp.]|jgi:hypothetical protein|nr:hypothetical protein [Rhizomicrobium sp.]